MSLGGEALWQAIVAAYARPGIAALCLRLQATGGVDVVLLLALCHAAARGAALSPSQVDRLRAATAPWRARAILPLRRLRIDLRQPVDGLDPAPQEAFRDRVKALELQAERLQVDLLAALLSEISGPAEPDPRAALRHLLGETPITEAELQDLREAFPL